MAEHETTEHRHGQMNIADQQRTFDAFIRFWIYLGAVVAVILIFLAIVGT